MLFLMGKERKKGNGKKFHFTLCLVNQEEKRTPGVMLVRTGKAKLKNIQQEGEWYRVTIFLPPPWQPPDY